MSKNKIYQMLIRYFHFEKLFLLPSFYVTIFILSFYDVMGNSIQMTFHRQFNIPMLSGIDAMKNVNEAMLFLFVLIPLLFFVTWILLSNLFKNIENHVALKYLQVISILGVVILFFTYTRKFSVNEEDWNLIELSTLNALNCLFIAVATYIGFHKYVRNFNLDFSIFERIVLSGISVILFIYIALLRLSCLLDGYQYGLLFLLYTLAMMVILNRYIRKLNEVALKNSFVPILFFPLLLFMIIEGTNILNQHNVFFNQKNIYILATFLLLSFFSIMYYFLSKKKSVYEISLKKCYFISLMGIFLISIQFPMYYEFGSELFESSNHGSGIHQLFSFGKLPIIETFDAHMLSNQMGGYLYGILNGDVLGAALNPYIELNYVLLITFLYLLLNHLFDEKSAFLICLFFPFYLDSSFMYHYMGLFAILSMLYILKKESMMSIIIYWFMCVFLCLYSLDIAFSFLLGSTITLIFYLILYGKLNLLKKFMLLGCAFVASSIVLFLILSLLKGVHPITRIMEILHLSMMSNGNWVTSNFGDSTKWIFMIVYIVIPIFVVGSLCNLIYIFFKNRKCEKQDVFTEVLLIALALTYIFNFSRGLVRHSLAEGGIKISLSLIILYFTIYVCFWHAQRRGFQISKFIFTYFIVFFSMHSILYNENLSYHSLISDANEKLENIEDYIFPYEEKVERTKISSKLSSKYQNLKQSMSILLNDDETYMDFTNQTLLYAIFDREKPVFVNQSPGLLCDDYTQLLFIDEIESFNPQVNIAITARDTGLIFGKDLDEIPLSFRYYLVSEYLNRNFDPLLNSDNFIIWIRKQNIENYKEQALKAVQSNVAKYVDENAYDSFESHIYSLGDIPYLWASYDQKLNEETDMQVLIENADVLDNSRVRFDKANIKIDEKQGNYIIVEAYSENDGMASIQLSDSEDKAVNSFNFALHKGTNKYAIRISCDDFWYKKQVPYVNLITYEEKLSTVSISYVNGK